MAFRIVFPEYSINIIVIICQILFVIACHTSYVNYYSIWTVELFSVNSPNMFTLQIVMYMLYLFVTVEDQPLLRRQLHDE